MRFHGRFGYEQCLGDLVIEQTRSHEIHNFNLSRREASCLRCGLPVNHEAVPVCEVKIVGADQDCSKMIAVSYRHNLSQEIRVRAVCTNQGVKVPGFGSCDPDCMRVFLALVTVA
jgi:hypothetical protein